MHALSPISAPIHTASEALQVGGVLCQSIYRDKRFRIVIGIGLNLSNREPTTCVDAAIEEEQKRLQILDAAEPVQPEACCPS